MRDLSVSMLGEVARRAALECLDGSEVELASGMGPEEKKQKRERHCDIPLFFFVELGFAMFALWFICCVLESTDRQQPSLCLRPLQSHCGVP